MAEDKPHYHNHRDRLRGRFASRGADSFEDYELLELYLFRCIPRVDTKPIAKNLISHFGSFADVLNAPISELTKVKGIKEKTALELKIVHAAALRLARENILSRQALSSWSAVLDYVRSAMQFEKNEQFRVLFLDKKNKLIADEVMSKGTVDRAAVYPREIIKRALDLHATALILVHNHPSGDPTPSHSDIEMTKTIADIGKPLSIVVHDHIIVGRDNTIGFKELGLM